MTNLEMDRNKYNVTGFNNNNVYSAVQTFLTNKRKKSERTAKTYEPTIHQFFQYAFGKKIGDVTWSELESINDNDILCFRDFLTESYSNNTVNQKLGHISALLKYLHNDNEKIMNGISDFDDVKLYYDQDNNTYGSLSKEEVDRLIEFAGQQHWKPLTQKMFFKVLFVTALRKTAVLSMTRKNIKHILDSTDGKYYWVISVFIKGKYINKSIPDSLYEELKPLIDETVSDDDLIFDINNKTLEKTLKQFCEQEGIGDERRICIHSLKKASGDFAFTLNRNIIDVAKHLDDSPRTAMRYYLHKNRNLASHVSLQFDKELDYSVLETLSKEELIAIIKDCGFAVAKPIIDRVGK